MESILNKHQVFAKTWLTFVFLFSLSLFTSKSLLTVTSIILIFWSFFDSKQRKIWINNKKVLCIMAFFPLALALNIFSLAPAAGISKLVSTWYWPLIAAPIISIFYNRRAIKIVFSGLACGLLIATVYSLFLFLQRLIVGSDVAFLSDNYRIASFWDVGRWGFFSGLAVITLFLLLHEKLNANFKKIIFTLIALTFFTFILTNSRAPFLSVLFVLLIVSLTRLQLLKNLILLITISVVVLFFNPAFSERLKSAFAVSLQPNGISSTHISNASRLFMWKVGFDFFKQQPFFGTGFENTEKPLRDFLNSQSASYVENVKKTEFSFNDQHSSYLNVLVQMGAIFFILFWGFATFIFIKYVGIFLKEKEPFLCFCLAGLLYCFAVFIFYSAISSYESIIFFTLLTLIGEPMSNRNSKSLIS